VNELIGRIEAATTMAELIVIQSEMSGKENKPVLAALVARLGEVSLGETKSHQDETGPLASGPVVHEGRDFHELRVATATFAFHGDELVESIDGDVEITVLPGVALQSPQRVDGTMVLVPVRSGKSGRENYQWIIGSAIVTVRYHIGSVLNVETTWGLIGEAQSEYGGFTFSGFGGALQYTDTGLAGMKDVVARALAMMWEWAPQNKVLTNLAGIAESYALSRAVSRAQNAVAMVSINHETIDQIATRQNEGPQRGARSNRLNRMTTDSRSRGWDPQNRG